MTALKVVADTRLQQLTLTLPLTPTITLNPKSIPNHKTNHTNPV